MRKTILGIVIVGASLCAVAGEQAEAGLFEAMTAGTPGNQVDALVLAELQRHGIEPAKTCSDEVFIRRVYLDILGTLPQPHEVRKFLQDKTPGKRSALIDALFEREEYAAYWSLKWCDLLRVKAEFPINLWPNAVQAYHKWLYDALRDNMPYNEFARALLTSSGSNFRVPPVNFYRAIQGQEPATIADAVGLTFMGVRLDGWPEEKRAHMAAFFSRVAYKGTAEWKEEIVMLDPSAMDALTAVLPDGKSVRIEAGQDPREVFADWLLSPGNPYFTRNIVNRTWAWLMGRGIIHEPDDSRPDNPPVNPALLAYLEEEFIKADYNLRHIQHLILNSQTYQQSSIPQSTDEKAEELFAHYIVRQLDAEVLIDALCWIFGPKESYLSMIPEPFTYVPEYQRSILLADGSITSPFLEMFGRPSRDTGLESERNNHPTDGQRLHMLNSTHIQEKIERSWRMRQILQANRNEPQKAIELMYLHILSRYPTEDEVANVRQYLEGDIVTGEQAAVDLAWALVNTKEFLFRH